MKCRLSPVPSEVKHHRPVNYGRVADPGSHGFTRDTLTGAVLESDSSVSRSLLSAYRHHTIDLRACLYYGTSGRARYTHLVFLVTAGTTVNPEQKNRGEIGGSNGDSVSRPGTVGATVGRMAFLLDSCSKTNLLRGVMTGKAGLGRQGYRPRRVPTPARESL